MTLIELSPRGRRLSQGERLEALIVEFGVFQVVRAALVATVRSKRQRVARIHVGSLPDHIRADVGLPPKVDPPAYIRHLY